MAPSEQQTPVRTPWRTFVVTVRRVVRLSPTFVRVTFTGPDLGEFADNGYDQRVKLILPVPGRGLQDLPVGPDWYGRWRSLPDDRRPVVRTYTVRAVRPAVAEVDFDIALHGDVGPASRWAAAAAVGDEVAILGPDAAFPGQHGGVEFRASMVDSATVLLAGDETAAPAILSIMERLPADARGDALIEVPRPDDRIPVRAPRGIRVRWLARSGRPHGSALIPALTDTVAHRYAANPAAANPAGADTGVPPSGPRGDTLVDDEMPWDVPDTDAPTNLYVWLAGEAGVIRTLRRHLVTDRGLDRRAVAFMGYWRQGHTETE